LPHEAAARIETPAGAAVELHRAPAGGAYAELERLTAGTITARLVPGLEVDMGALLG